MPVAHGRCQCHSSRPSTLAPIARALYAASCGAGVLILDEPAANLDVRAEAELYERFLDITSGLTTVLISHRLSTVRRANRIAVVQGGKVIEQGSHEELLALKGSYADMFALQASRFTDDRPEKRDDSTADV